MGRHNKPAKTKVFLRRTGVLAALAGATVGGIVTTGAGTANAFPGQSGLVMCESGGNPAAVNNTAAGQRAGRPAGLFQIVTSTWLANGGGQYAPTADRAAAWQQQIVADRIYARQGSAPWACHTGSGPAKFSDFGRGGAVAQQPVTPHAATPHAATPHSTTSHSATTHVSRSATVAAPAATSRQGSNPNGDYTVVAGDTLSGIAHRFNVPGGWQALQKLNAAYIPNANLILVGQKIATK